MAGICSMSDLKEISTEGFFALYEKNPNLCLIDVRSEEEFLEVHAKMAKLIPLDQIDKNSIADLAKLAKDQPVYLICRSGRRSATAGEIFLEAGYQEVYNVLGGTLDWVDKNLPTT